MKTRTKANRKKTRGQCNKYQRSTRHIVRATDAPYNKVLAFVRANWPAIVERRAASADIRTCDCALLLWEAHKGGPDV